VHRWIAAAALFASALPAGAVDPGELLDPQDAFRLTVKGADRHAAELEFRIAAKALIFSGRQE